MPCAQRDRVEQFQVDFMSQAAVQISHTGGSDVFVSGFKVIAPIMEEEQQRETDSDDEPFSPEGLEEDDEEEDDEEVEEEGEEVRQATPDWLPHRVRSKHPSCNSATLVFASLWWSLTSYCRDAIGGCQCVG